MTAKIVELGPKSRMNVEEVLSLALRNHADFTDVMVIGIYSTEDHERLNVMTSTMSHPEAVYFALEALDAIRND